MATRARRKTAAIQSTEGSNSSPVSENPESSSESSRHAERPQKRRITARQLLEDDDGSKVNVKHCDKANCQSLVPVCFAEATEKCARTTATTSRWYHLSPGEHFCNECFDNFYRSHKDGYAEYTRWKKVWSSNGTTETNVKAFMNDQILPYWVQCRACSRWRALPKGSILTRQYSETFKCTDINGVECSTSEDSRVAATRDAHWIDTLVLPPYLKSSPAAPHVTDYYPDGVGMSASEERSRSGPAKVNHKYLQPFHDPNGSHVAAALRPDLMDWDETKEFPEFTFAQQMYLGLRNLVVALWNENPMHWLTAEKCAPYVICRGLARIRCMLEVEHIVYFLTRKGIINTGLLPQPVPADLKHDSKCEIVVVGAGVAGLAAARQLHNLGLRVRVLEAKGQLGGRAQAVHLAEGVTASTGADSISGALNNPVALLCIQGGLTIQERDSRCLFLKSDGTVVGGDVQRKMDFHFNSLLDVVTEFYKDETNPTADVSLGDKLAETFRIFAEESDLPFSEDEEALFSALMHQMELGLGTRLSSLSAMHWDQHETFTQFAGQLFTVAEGLESVLRKLAEPLDIRLNAAVSKIDLGESCIRVHTSEDVLTCAKVLVTLPLSSLKQGKLVFEPPLPPAKVRAIEALGTGRLEKVLLQFPSNFWSEKIKDSACFCSLEAVQAKRLFTTFLDLSQSSKGANILATFAIADDVTCFGEKTDKDIVADALTSLRSIFGHDVVPPPTSHFVSHWASDAFIGMSNSYVPVGCLPSAYDTVAEDVSDRLYFAGEACMRSHPQTVTGAYLSGIREAIKIITTSHA